MSSKTHTWRKVMAAHRRVDDVSPAGWLPVHRDQLRDQRSVTSMGSLYLFNTWPVRCNTYTITAHWPLTIYNAFWQGYSGVNNLLGVNGQLRPDRGSTRHLLTANRTTNRLRRARSVARINKRHFLSKTAPLTGASVVAVICLIRSSDASSCTFSRLQIKKINKTVARINRRSRSVC